MMAILSFFFKNDTIYSVTEFPFEKKYRPRLLNFVLRKVGSIEDAEEIVQDTLLSAYYSLPSFSHRSSFYSWVCAIARHEIADFYRKKRIKEIFFSVFPGFRNIVTRALSPEMALEEKEMKEKVLACLSQLTEGYRVVLRLKYYQGLSVGEIADKLGKSAKAIEMRLRRARLAFIAVWNEENGKNSIAQYQGGLFFFEKRFRPISPSLPDDSGNSA